MTAVWEGRFGRRHDFHPAGLLGHSRRRATTTRRIADDHTKPRHGTRLAPRFAGRHTRMTGRHGDLFE